MKFSIGEFSIMTSLTIKSLRFYHEKKLLIPAEVEEFSGYRYYDENNFETARAIKILKGLDFTLAEIKEILEECDEEVDMLEFLEHKLEEISGKIQRYSKISHSIKTMIKFEEENIMSKNESFEIEEKQLDTILIAGYRIKGKYEDTGKNLGILGKKIGRHINGKPMNLYYDAEYKETDADIETCFPVRKGMDIEGISIRELKGGKCLSLIHKGPYDTLGNSYKKLYTYINEKGFIVKLPSREVYIKGPGMIFRGNPNNYLTELQAMIED